MLETQLAGQVQACINKPYCSSAWQSLMVFDSHSTNIGGGGEEEGCAQIQLALQDALSRGHW